jgi:nicotinate-nucleotide pyrophosphorylase (carboxylating)
MRRSHLPPRHAWAPLVEWALAEDLRSGDATTRSVVPPDAAGRARIEARQPLTVCGLDVAREVFARVDPALRFETLVADGTRTAAGDVLARLDGSLHAILAGERTALNFLQRMSGIATLTRRYVTRLEGTKAQLRDTRKTTPGLRLLERYAVRVGGGSNHRMGLYDAVLIKENHARLAGGVAEAVRRARQKYGRAQAIQAEVRDDAELRQALEAGADAVLLDNMSVEQVDLAVELVRGRCVVEASGGIKLDNIRAYAECGVDYISVGALTHSAPAAEISFDLQPAGPER